MSKPTTERSRAYPVLTLEDSRRAAGSILERLADFNRDRNLLSPPFRFRLGAHTGVSLVDLDAGVAYSDVLDLAGHIQKKAEPNTLVISQATLDSLMQPVSVTPIEEQVGEAGSLFRVDSTEGEPRGQSPRPDRVTD